MVRRSSKPRQRGLAALAAALLLLRPVGSSPLPGGEALLGVGAEVEAAPGQAYTDETGIEYYQPGDHGLVSGYVSKMVHFRVTWVRTGRTTTMDRSDIDLSFKVLRRAPELHVADTMEALPGKKFKTQDGIEYFEAGDTCTITKLYDPPDEQLFTVMWTRTARYLNLSRSSWPGYCKLVNGTSLHVGDLVQAKKSNQAIYEEGDIGRVSGFVQVEGVETVEVTWERTGRASHERRELWSERYALASPAPKIAVGGLLQALPERSSTGPEREYGPGDLGTISSVRYSAEDPTTGTFEIEWDRTAKKSQHNITEWASSFKWLGKPNLGSDIQQDGAAGDLMPTR